MLILAEKKKTSEKKEIETQLKEVNSQLKKFDTSMFRTNVTNIIKNTFIELGYKVEMKLLNSANYGVPQKRERVIFIGLRNDISKDICYPIETHNKEGTNGKQKMGKCKRGN